MSCGEVVTLEICETVEQLSLECNEYVESLSLEIREIAGPPGADGAPGVGAEVLEAENKDVVTIRAGQAVSVHPSGVGVRLASKAHSFTRRAIGVARADTAPGFAVEVERTRLELDDWTLVVGSATLPAAATLWLSDDGLLSANPVIAPGQIVQVIGETISPTELALRISEPYQR